MNERKYVQVIDDCKWLFGYVPWSVFGETYADVFEILFICNIRDLARIGGGATCLHFCAQSHFSNIFADDLDEYELAYVEGDGVGNEWSRDKNEEF